MFSAAFKDNKRKEHSQTAGAAAESGVIAVEPVDKPVMNMDTVCMRMQTLELQVDYLSQQNRSFQAWSTRSWALALSHPMSRIVLQEVQQWKDTRPSKGPHHLGACRAVVAASIIQYIEMNPLGGREAKLMELHKKAEGKIAKLGDLSVNMASAKETKLRDQEIMLLKIRPHFSTMDACFPIFDWLDEQIVKELELTGPAPPSTNERAIAKNIQKFHPKKRPKPSPAVKKQKEVIEKLIRRTRRRTRTRGILKARRRDHLKVIQRINDHLLANKIKTKTKALRAKKTQIKLMCSLHMS